MHLLCSSLNLSHPRNRAGGRGLTSSRWQKRWCDFSDGVFRYSSAIGSRPNEIRLEDIVSVSSIVEQERVSLRSARSSTASDLGDRLTLFLPPFPISPPPAMSKDARQYTFEIRTSSKRGTYVLSAEKEDEFKKVRSNHVKRSKVFLARVQRPHPPQQYIPIPSSLPSGLMS
jgi:hypothetical protein